MRRRIALALLPLCGALAALLATATTANAHPLGNFTVNRYAGIEIAGSDVYVRYALDLAEIPTYQLGSEIRQAGYPAVLARDLALTLDGRRIPLRVVEYRAVSRPGAGGLKTMRLDVVYRARGEGSALVFRDTSFPGRIGWREVTVSARDGGQVVASDVPATSASAALRKYPSDLLRSPLDTSAVSARIELGSKAAPPPTIDGVAAPRHAEDGFEALIEEGTRSRRGTARRWSPRTSSERGGRRATHSCSAGRSRSRTPPESSRSGS